jgi:hypothetical protein
MKGQRFNSFFFLTVHVLVLLFFFYIIYCVCVCVNNKRKLMRWGEEIRKKAKNIGLLKYI